MAAFLDLVLPEYFNPCLCINLYVPRHKLIHMVQFSLYTISAVLEHGIAVGFGSSLLQLVCQGSAEVLLNSKTPRPLALVALGLVLVLEVLARVAL